MQRIFMLLYQRFEATPYDYSSQNGFLSVVECLSRQILE